MTPFELVLSAIVAALIVSGLRAAWQLFHVRPHAPEPPAVCPPIEIVFQPARGHVAPTFTLEEILGERATEPP